MQIQTSLQFRMACNLVTLSLTQWYGMRLHCNACQILPIIINFAHDNDEYFSSGCAQAVRGLAGRHGRLCTSSECVRQLIRRDQEREQLRNLLLTGAQSAPSGLADDVYFAGLRSGINKPLAGSE